MEIVHFTDLHFKKANPFQHDLIRALNTDLRIERSRGLSPDFVLFSGDLVHNPDDPGIYSAFERDVMTPILHILGLSPNRTIICPGNHDISQKGMEQRKLIYDALHNKGLDQSSLAKHRSSADFTSYCRHISEGFFSISNQFGKDWVDPLNATYDFPEQNVCFLALNSSFLCSLEGSSRDRGKLAYPVEAVLESFHRIPSGRAVISLSHHSWSDFGDISG